MTLPSSTHLPRSIFSGTRELYIWLKSANSQDSSGILHFTELLGPFEIFNIIFYHYFSNGDTLFLSSAYYIPYFSIENEF